MSFSINLVPEAYQKSMIQYQVWTAECPFGFDRLRLLNIKHYNFDHQIIDGEIIVFDVVAEATIAIFTVLLQQKFPIFSLRLIDHFSGNDENSMAHNNSSCFNYRPISGCTKLSLHAMGMAIDINPLQNPCLVINRQTATAHVQPPIGIDYLNRSKNYLGQIEPVVKIFKNNGFKIWGGDWSEPIDYQHFQVERHLAEQLIHLNYVKGSELFASLKLI